MTINSSQSIAWDAVPGASSYDVQLTGNPPGAAPVVDFTDLTSTSLPATVLLAGKSFGSYNVKVRAKEAAGPGDWSSWLSLTYENLPAPANLRVE